MKQAIISEGDRFYGFVPHNCSLSAFIDLLWFMDSRKRHFKRLQTFAKYEVYPLVAERLKSQNNMSFGIKNETLILDADHKIVGNVRFVQLDPAYQHSQQIDFYDSLYLYQIRKTLNEVLREQISLRLYGTIDRCHKISLP